MWMYIHTMYVHTYVCICMYIRTHQTVPRCSKVESHSICDIYNLFTTINRISQCHSCTVGGKIMLKILQYYTMHMYLLVHYYNYTQNVIIIPHNHWFRVNINHRDSRYNGYFSCAFCVVYSLFSDDRGLPIQ